MYVYNKAMQCRMTCNINYCITGKLEKWEATPISHVCKELNEVHSLLRQQRVTSERNFNVLNEKLNQLRFAAL